MVNSRNTLRSVQLQKNSFFTCAVNACNKIKTITIVALTAITTAIIALITLGKNFFRQRVQQTLNNQQNNKIINTYRYNIKNTNNQPELIYRNKPKNFHDNFHDNFDKMFGSNAKEIIKDIITKVDTTNSFLLKTKSKELKNLGEKIKHIPTLKFLTFILLGNLKKHLVKISKTKLKWDPYGVDAFKINLINGLSEWRKKNNEEFFKDLQILARLTKTNYQTLKVHTDNNEWDEFFSIILNH